MNYDFSILDMLPLLDNFSSLTQMNYMPPMGKDLEVAIAYCLKDGTYVLNITVVFKVCIKNSK